MVERLFGDYMLEQSDEFFKLTTDSVFLSDFIEIKQGEKALELGTGAGALWVLAAAKNANCIIDGAEILQKACELAQKNKILNAMEHRGAIKCCDIAEITAFFDENSYDVCFCNPPYFDRAIGEVSPNASRESARGGALEAFIHAASQALRNGGRFYFCYRNYNKTTENLLINNGFSIMETRNICEKKVIFTLIFAQKGGKIGENKAKNVCIFDEHGNYTDEYRKAYRLDK